METSGIVHETEKGQQSGVLTSDEKFRVGYASIDPKEERKLVRKLDIHIIPVGMLLYLLSFIDRRAHPPNPNTQTSNRAGSVNIGNARLYGLEEDLNLTSSQYTVAVSVLFATYLSSELPSNLIIKNYVRPSRWIAFITTSWGIIATLTGIVQGYGGLLACRLLLGLVEGGLFPGCAIYLTFFYTKRELALRIGYLFVSAAIAGSLGGLLAYGIGFMDGIAGLRGWRWIMILEGIPTFILGISCIWLLADDPDTAYYLNAHERQMIKTRRAAQLGVNDDFAWPDVRKGLADWKIWVFCAGQFCTDTVLYGYSTFLPTIIEAIRPDASAAVVQLLTIPCYAVGAISYMLTARLSDWRQLRGPPVVALCLTSVLGYALLIAPINASAHYAGCFLVALGLYVAVGVPLAWLPTNNPRFGKRTTATGLQLTIGNSSGIMAPFLYPKGEGPRYVRGHAVTMGLVAFAAVLFGGMSVYFDRENKRRERGERDGAMEGLSEEEVLAMGDENPKFRFAT